jgi:hypothetical protein
MGFLRAVDPGLVPVQVCVLYRHCQRFHSLVFMRWETQGFKACIANRKIAIVMNHHVHTLPTQAGEWVARASTSVFAVNRSPPFIWLIDEPVALIGMPHAVSPTVWLQGAV